ncbi:MAG: SCO family protein [bacterium]|nr:SCO family protein [bacterium]
MPTAARIFAAAMLAALTACSSHAGGRNAASAPDYGAAPAFSLPDAAGGTFSLAAHRGGVVVLSFVAANCSQECPQMEAVLKRGAERWRAAGMLGKHVTIATVELDPKSNSMLAVARLRAKTWPADGWAFLRGTPEQTRAVLAGYGITVLPPPKGHDDVEHTAEVYVIDPNGRESAILAPGANLTLRSLEQAVSSALAAPRGA